mgnify:CR=1 FL=1
MQNFYWYLICALRAIFCRLPHKTAVRLGDVLGRVMWLVCKSRVDKAEARCVRALGIGVTPPDASLGYMLSEAQGMLTSAPWYALGSGGAIVLLIFGVGLIGEGLQRRNGGVS